MPVPPFPSVPSSLSTYVNGPLVVSQLRSDLTNGLNFLANRPSFTGFCTSGPTIPGNAWTAVTLDSGLSDPWQGHSPLGSSPQNWYCQAPGWYLCEGYVPWVYTLTITATFGAAIGVNTAGGLVTHQGQVHVTKSGQDPGVFAADLVHLTRTGIPGAAGTDYVQLQAYNTGVSGEPLDATPPANVPRLSVRWAGTGAASSLPVPVNAAWPVPPAFITTAWLESNIVQMLQFLSNPPMLRAANPGIFANNLPSTTWPAGTALALSDPAVDNYGAFSASAWTAPVAGLYYIHGQVSATAPASPCTLAAGITINGTTTWVQSVFTENGGSFIACPGGGGRFRLNAGDQVSLTGFQDSGLPLTTDANTRLIVFWESS